MFSCLTNRTNGWSTGLHWPCLSHKAISDIPVSRKRDAPKALSRTHSQLEINLDAQTIFSSPRYGAIDLKSLKIKETTLKKGRKLENEMENLNRLSIANSSPNAKKLYQRKCGEFMRKIESFVEKVQKQTQIPIDRKQYF